MRHATLKDWEIGLTRQGRNPSPWLGQLTRELDLLLAAERGADEKEYVATRLLQSPRFGACDAKGALSSEALLSWEHDRAESLWRVRDDLYCRPSVELPLLVREFAQWLELPGLDAVGARLNDDAQRIRWQKDLIAQGCQAFRWDREAGVAQTADWVPRLKREVAGNGQWPTAPSVTLPIFFVTQRGDQQEQGVNGWLRLWLWPCEVAQLELLPSVPQRVLPLAQSWVGGLERASQWMRQQMRGQGGAWKDHALVWEVHTNEVGHDLLMGDSASAAFALAGLWLARTWAPPKWAGLLSSLCHDDWRDVRITAAIVPEGTESVDAKPGSDLTPVGGGPVKSLASWVLGQGSAGREPPLRVSQGQRFEITVPGQHMPPVVEYRNAHELLKALAHDALDLGDTSLGPLLGALLPALHHFAPDPATSAEGMAAVRNLPRLETTWQAPMADRTWQALVRKAAADRHPSTTLEAFALRRWATLAQEQHEGGSVNCLFVNLSVDEQHRPRQSRNGGSYSLDQLMAEYEQDSGFPDHEVQALMLVGAPGGGKTWLLQRFEQACAERLLWQLDQQGRRSEPDSAAADTLAFLDVPLYVSLSGLPTKHKSEKDIVSWFCTQVLGSPNAPDSRLQRRLLRPESEKGLRLRIILDGLNEVKVAGAEERASRVKGVVRALWERLQPGLPMLLGTRTHHLYKLDHTSATGQRFNVAVATLNPWAPAQMEGYLRKRWASQEYAHLREMTPALMAKINSDDAKGQRLREVLSVPRYLRGQCELLEAGGQELMNCSTLLLAALLRLKLHQEMVSILNQGQDKADIALPVKQVRTSHTEIESQVPPFPSSRRRIYEDIVAFADCILVVDNQVPRCFSGEVVEWILEADQEPASLGNVIELKALVKHLSSGTFLDIQTVRSACKQRSKLTIEGEDAAYKNKYDAKYFVPRREIERHIELMLVDKRLPVLFLKAGSGQGKTCFVRNLYDRLEKTEYSIPILVRGLSGVSKQVRISEILVEIAEQVAKGRDLHGCSPIDAMDQALSHRGLRLVVILDGVNEASGDPSAVLNDAIEFLKTRIDQGRQLGFYTSIRMIITSRPAAITGWYNDTFVTAELLGKVKLAGSGAEMPSTAPLLELNNLSEEELDEALQLSELGTVDSHLRKLLADPLLLGFYRELSVDAFKFDLGRSLTPLTLINSYWERQLDQIRKLSNERGAVRGGDDYLDAIKDFCRRLLGSRDSIVEVKWGVEFKQILVREVLLFEQISAAEKNKPIQLAFRYDRLAQLLVARFAILEEDGSRRSVNGIGELLIRVTLATTQEATFLEKDVIRNSLIDALKWRMETEPSETTVSTFDLALSLLNEAHPALVGVERADAESCLLVLSEVVHDFILESGPWHGPKIVNSINAWLTQNQSDDSSLKARVIRRVVFNLLRADSLGESTSPIEAENAPKDRLRESRKILQGLGAIALLTDASGDPAVLLHALHREGKVEESLAILDNAVRRLSKSKIALWTPAGLIGIKRVCLALLLIAPDAIKDGRYLTCVSEVLKSLPAPLIATSASLLTDMALRDNAMPFRMDEWEKVRSGKNHFQAVVSLLSDDGWSNQVVAEFASVSGVRRLSGLVRNGVVTQLLSSALSCRILLADEADRSDLVAELEQVVADMCTTAQFLESINESDPGCELGASAYLLSLVCYHLIVFDAPKILELEGRPYLPRNIADRVFQCMYRLADEVLLQAPFLGRFRFHPESGARETSNIVGTLGRAALEMGSPENFQRLVINKAQSLAVDPSTRYLTSEQLKSLKQRANKLKPVGDLLSRVDFGDFLLESLATLGTLSQNPKFALTCIYDTASALGAPAFALSEPAQENDFELAYMQSAMKALLQVRTVHPLAVEQYIMERYQDKRRAAPVLRHLRLAEPIKLSRYLSWTFEHCIERIIADYPQAVRFVRDDTLQNLHPNGLRVVAARVIFRLVQWANSYPNSQGRESQILGAKQRAWAQVAGFIGGPGGQIGAAIKRSGKLVKAAGKSEK